MRGSSLRNKLSANSHSTTKISRKLWITCYLWLLVCNITILKMSLFNPTSMRNLMLISFKNTYHRLKHQICVYTCNLSLSQPSALKLNQSMAQIIVAISSMRTSYLNSVHLIYPFQLPTRRLLSLLQMSSSQNQWKSWHQKMIKLSLNFPLRSQKVCGLNKITFSSHPKRKFHSSSTLQIVTWLEAQLILCTLKFGRNYSNISPAK